jgi:hypothetical protein
MRNLWHWGPRVVFALCASFAIINGCGSSSDTYSTHCGIVSSRVLQPSEKSPLGFSPNEVFTPAAGLRSGALQWAKGGTTSFELEVTPVSPFRYVETEVVHGNDGLDIGVQCDNVVEADATISLKTADGAFAESWPAVIQSQSAFKITAWVNIDPSAIQGSYEITEIDLTRYANPRLHLKLEFSGAWWSGSIAGGAERSVGEAVEYRIFDVASFSEAGLDGGVADAAVDAQDGTDD